MSTAASQPNATPPAAPDAELRAEHDALGQRLAVRRSIDHVRSAYLLGFLSFISFGMSGKLAWDRWGPPEPGTIKVIPPGGPMFFLIAVAVTLVLVAFTVRSARRATKLMREEDALFARFRAVRAKLGLDA